MRERSFELYQNYLYIFIFEYWKWNPAYRKKSKECVCNVNRTKHHPYLIDEQKTQKVSFQNSEQNVTHTWFVITSHLELGHKSSYLQSSRSALRVCGQFLWWMLQIRLQACFKKSFIFRQVLLRFQKHSCKKTILYYSFFLNMEVLRQQINHL